jgi:hypothetical protein
MATTTTGTTLPPSSNQQLTPQQQAVIDAIKGGQSDKKAIGVPNDYSVTKGKSGERKDEFKNFMGPVGPDAMKDNNVGVQYWEGDQLYPAGWDPQDILKLQLQMRDAGVYGKQKYTPGVWDQTSQDAMERIMGYANAAGVSKEDIMSRWKQYADSSDQTGAVLTLKNPEDIKNYLQQTAGKVIGRSLSPAELNTLTAGYQDIDRTAQEQDAAAQAAAANGKTTSVTSPISVETYADQQLRNRFSDEAHWVTANSRMQEFYSILGAGGGSGGGASNG